MVNTMNTKIYFLWEYEWHYGTLLKENAKSYKIFFPGSGMLSAHERRVPKENCALPGESVCVVWQKWTSARGSYRVERELYPNRRILAENIGPAHLRGKQGRVWETAYGVEE